MLLFFRTKKKNKETAVDTFTLIHITTMQSFRYFETGNMKIYRFLFTDKLMMTDKCCKFLFYFVVEIFLICLLENVDVC